jgi:hypothetical protein
METRSVEFTPHPEYNLHMTKHVLVSRAWLVRINIFSNFLSRVGIPFGRFRSLVTIPVSF